MTDDSVDQPTMQAMVIVSSPAGRWRKGQSGNPSGRPKKSDEEYALEKACEQKSPLALKTILDLMQHAEKETVRLQAAQFIIERRFGKALHRVESQGTPLDRTATAILLEMRRTIEGRMKDTTTPDESEEAATDL